MNTPLDLYSALSWSHL